MIVRVGTPVHIEVRMKSYRLIGGDVGVRQPGVGKADDGIVGPTVAIWSALYPWRRSVNGLAVATSVSADASTVQNAARVIALRHWMPIWPLRPLSVCPMQ
jgi:hypothetical protein